MRNKNIKEAISDFREKYLEQIWNNTVADIATKNHQDTIIRNTLDDLIVFFEENHRDYNK